jgi:hypothetical protein
MALNVKPKHAPEPCDAITQMIVLRCALNVKHYPHQTYFVSVTAWRRHYDWLSARLIKSCHIAAIGLLTVWYLLAPPFIPGDPPGPLQLNAPLSQWSQMDSSDTDLVCEEPLDNMVRMYQSGDMTSMATQFKLWLYHNAMCVSSAGPRLTITQQQAYLSEPLKPVV